MKVKIKARKNAVNTWYAHVLPLRRARKVWLAACNSDVSELFAIGKAKQADFVISTTEPRGDSNYHKFDYNGFAYRATDITGPFAPVITRCTSRSIRSLLFAKGAKSKDCASIYVSVYA